MSVNDIRAMYDALVDSGDLNEMFPNLTGVWEKDQKEFSRAYETTEHLLEDDDDDLFEDLNDEY